MKWSIYCSDACKLVLQKLIQAVVVVLITGFSCSSVASDDVVDLAKASLKSAVEPEAQPALSQGGEAKQEASFIHSSSPIYRSPNESGASDGSSHSIQTKSPASQTMSEPTQAVGQVAVGLFVVVGVILGLAWLAKRFGLNSLNHQREMRVVSTISLGGREKAVLVEVAGQQLLLGVSPGRVNHLHTLGCVSASSNHLTNVKTEGAQQKVSLGTEKTMRGQQPDNLQPASPVDMDFSTYLKSILMPGSKG